MSLRARDFISAQDLVVAAALYNSIRTTLEEGGWTQEVASTTPGYWWQHPDHSGTYAMDAAIRQQWLDAEKRLHSAG